MLVEKKVGSFLYIRNKETGLAIRLNKMGAKIYYLTKEGYSPEEIIQIFLKEYSVPESRLRTEIEKIISLLKKTSLTSNSKSNSPFKFQSASWDITYACNLKCKHCLVSAGPQNPTKPFSTLKVLEIIKALRDYGISICEFSGGEPLVREDFPEILRYCKEVGMLTGVLTNGTLIDKKWGRILYKNDVNYIQISIDGPSETDHELIRGGGTFSRAIKGIKIVKELGMTVEIASMITKKILAAPKDMVELAVKLGVDQISFSKFQLRGRSKKPDFSFYVEPNPAQIHSFFLKLYQLSEEYKDQIIISNPIRNAIIARNFDLTVTPCSSQSGNLMIDPIGRISICKLADYKEFRISTGESIKKALNSFDCSRIGVISAEEIESCRGCEYIKICGGGCRLRAFEETGSIYGPDPACEERKKLYKWIEQTSGFSRGGKDN